MQEGHRPDSISIGSAHPEAAAREAQAYASQEPDQEVAGGTGGFTLAGMQASQHCREGGTPHGMGDQMAEGEDPADEDASQHAAPVMHPARPLSHLPLMREV